MRTLIVFSLFVTFASAVHLSGGSGSLDEAYAASLAGAPVGLYGKKHEGGPGGPYGGGFGGPYGGGFGGPYRGGFGGPYRGGFGGPYGGRISETYGTSLGGAKVGLYGKNHDQQQGGAYPVPRPVYGKPAGYPRPRGPSY